MIDLRSDTLTVPTQKMRKAMHDAEVGDEGRTDSTGKGEDPTLNALESLASEISGKRKFRIFAKWYHGQFSGSAHPLPSWRPSCHRGKPAYI